MAKRIIQIRSFSYLNEEGDRYLSVSKGGEIDTKDLSDRELELAEEINAFEPEADGEAEEGFDAADLSVEDLAAYIKAKRLNVGDTVALAGDDAELAEHVLEAEQAVTGREPRDGVVTGLEKIINES